MRKINISGSKIGKLLVLRRIESEKRCDGGLYECKCDCGNLATKSFQYFKRKFSIEKSCGCIKRLKAPNFKYLVGQRYGRLVVISRAGNNNKQNSIWKCKCDCGNENTVLAFNLVSGQTKSCGCLKKNWMKSGVAIQNRIFANYKRSAKYRKLEFEIDFEKFVAICEMPCSYCGDKPDKLTIGKNGQWIHGGVDRIDSSKGYIDGNCTPACEICNLMKFDIPVDTFYEKIDKIYNRIHGL